MTTVIEWVMQNGGTSGIAGLSQQVAQQLVRSLPAMSITDIRQHVAIANPAAITYLQRSAGDSLIRAITERGQALRLCHALRALPEQYALWQLYVDGRGPRAESPGTSPFEYGIAVELEDHLAWVTVLRKHGWQWLYNTARFNYHGPHDPEFGRHAVMAFQRVWNNHNAQDPLEIDGVITPGTIARLEQSPAAGF